MIMASYKIITIKIVRGTFLDLCYKLSLKKSLLIILLHTCNWCILNKKFTRFTSIYKNNFKREF